MWCSRFFWWDSRAGAALLDGRMLPEFRRQHLQIVQASDHELKQHHTQNRCDAAHSILHGANHSRSTNSLLSLLFSNPFLRLSLALCLSSSFWILCKDGAADVSRRMLRSLRSWGAGRVCRCFSRLFVRSSEVVGDMEVVSGDSGVPVSTADAMAVLRLSRFAAIVRIFCEYGLSV